MEPPIAVPENKPLLKLLENFRRKGVHDGHRN